MNHMCNFYNILGQTGGRPVNREYPFSDVRYMDTFVKCLAHSSVCDIAPLHQERASEMAG